MSYVWWTGRGNPKRRNKNYWKWLKNKPIIISEKLDGGQTCISYDGNVYARSHGFLAEHETFDYLKAKLWQWKNYLRKHRLDVFGENLYGIHSVEYCNLSEWFYVFGARKYRSDKFEKDQYDWVSWNEVIRIAKDMKLPLVSYVEVQFDDEKDFIWEAKQFAQFSSLGDECEGFVVRLADGFSRRDFRLSQFKYVSADFMNKIPDGEEGKIHWKYNWKKAPLMKKQVDE